MPATQNSDNKTDHVSQQQSEIKQNDEQKIMDESEITELRRISSPLKSVNAGEDNEDLAAIRAIIGNATVVALGESTHGTSEFFKMKHRVLEYLVTEMGFTIFSIEANMSTCQRINEYVLGAKANLKDLIRSLICWPWETQEVFDMVEWMRRYNLTAEIKLQFTGFDIYDPTISSAIIKKNLLGADVKSDTNLDTVINGIKRAKETLNVQYSSEQEERQARKKFSESEDYKKLIKDINMLRAEIRKNRAHLESKLGKFEYEWILQNASLLLQSAQSLLDDSLGSRDKAMAENVLWIQKQNPGAKIVLWAHNLHIHKQHYKECPHKPMGQYLAASLNDYYRAIGFSTYEGTYTAIHQRKFPPHRNLVLFVPPIGSLEDNLKRIGYPIALINLRETKEVTPRCLKGNLSLRNTGSLEEGDEGSSFELPYNLRAGYDGIIYVEKTTASQLITRVQPVYLNLKYECLFFKSAENVRLEAHRHNLPEEKYEYDPGYDKRFALVPYRGYK